MRTHAIAIAAAAAAMALVGQAFAAVGYDFTSASGDFNEPTNWTPVGVPTLGNVFSINGKNVTVSQLNDWTGERFTTTGTVSNGSTLTITNTGSLAFLTYPSESLFVNVTDSTWNVAGKYYAHNSTATNSTVNISAGADFQPLGLGLANSTFTMTGGLFKFRRADSANDGLRVRSGSTATIAGGRIDAPIYVGGGAAGSTSFANFTGGIVNDDTNVPAWGDTRPVNVGALAANTRGEMVISNGARFDTGLKGNGAGFSSIGGGFDNAAGKVTIQSGKFYNVALRIGNANGLGSGELVIGSDPTNEIRVGRGWGSMGTHFVLESNGTITWNIDGTSVPAVQVDGVQGVYGDGTGSAQNAILHGVIDLNLVNGFTPAIGATYDLVKLTGGTITDSTGLALAAEDVPFWNLSISPDNKTLTATVVAVPEPGLLALLAFAAPALLPRRRQKA